MSAALAALVRSRRIEEVPADPVTARASVEEARRHLASAEAVASSDPAGAYQLLYDAARKAVAAHMLANGYRATARPGPHEAVVRYAEEVFTSAGAARHVRNLDRMRRNRNRSEYGMRVFGRAEIDADLEHARQVVDVVDTALQRAE